MRKKNVASILTLLVLLLGAAFNFLNPAVESPATNSGTAVITDTAAPYQAQAFAPEKDGWYYLPEDVAAYLDVYGRLPGNYLTKSEAEALGWNSREDNLWEVADGMCIGGDRFSNREGVVPDASGRRWYECDVNYAGGYRGAERLLYSSDGLIYYTPDHYETAVQLYPDDEKGDKDP